MYCSKEEKEDKMTDSSTNIDGSADAYTENEHNNNTDNNKLSSVENRVRYYHTYRFAYF
jgi:hypothetical protein